MEKQTAWALVYGVDGFGADTAPALEEGIFLNKEKALKHCIKLNLKQLEKEETEIYEDGWGEDVWDEKSEDGKILSKLCEENDFDNPLWEEISNKHILKGKKAAERLSLQDEPRMDYYCIRETFIR